ncbi:hypothetical protein SteCoe_30048 [Stentor coeruleus]|uniref:Uncharacterized protein n=1 Tax=Stentor coeruleus TaxID=5963 RepID=A0A1R2B4I8_9CILI|nr:hypothetical protein SteCoe_30048 [Stentor coeruleus]
MEKPRFSPEWNNPQVVLLQKEIYKKEEKHLGLKLPSEKERFERFIRELKPRFSGILKDYKKSDLSYKDNTEGENISKSQYLHQRGSSIVELSYIKPYQQPKLTNRTWDLIHNTNPRTGNEKDKKYFLIKKSLQNIAQRKNIFY